MHKKVFILLILFTYQAFSQKVHEPKFRVSSKISQYLFGNFPFSLDVYVADKITLGADIAYKPALTSGGEILPYTLGDDYLMQNFWNGHYNSITIGFHSKVFLIEKAGIYTEPNVYHRYWWFKDQQVYFENDENYSFEGTRSERQNVSGANILVGKTFEVFSLHGVTYFVDLDFGPGFLYKQYTFETKDGTVNGVYHDQYVESGDDWQATLNFGISLGVQF